MTDKAEIKDKKLLRYKYIHFYRITFKPDASSRTAAYIPPSILEGARAMAKNTYAEFTVMQIPGMMLSVALRWLTNRWLGSSDCWRVGES